MIVGSMKKISGLLTALLLFSGCAETMALLGPASTSLGGGNVLRSTVSSTVSYGVKKQTGMSPTQHVLSYAEKENSKKKKEPNKGGWGDGNFPPNLGTAMLKPR